MRFLFVFFVFFFVFFCFFIWIIWNYLEEKGYVVVKDILKQEEIEKGKDLFWGYMEKLNEMTSCGYEVFVCFFFVFFFVFFVFLVFYLNYLEEKGYVVVKKILKQEQIEKGKDLFWGYLEKLIEMISGYEVIVCFLLFFLVFIVFFSFFCFFFFVFFWKKKDILLLEEE